MVYSNNMNSINYVNLFYIIMILCFFIIGALLNVFEKYLSDFLRQTLLYGKFSHGRKSILLKSLEIPKSWFRHFYIYSSTLNVCLLILILGTYTFGIRPPVLLINILDEVGGYNRSASVTPVHVLLATVLFTLHTLRRLYETHFVSVFGKDSRMNIWHYSLTYFHYTGCFLAISLEAPLFSVSGSQGKVHLGHLKLADYLATVLFFWACYHQYTTAKILGDLRKNEKGKVVTQNYKMPQGDWFKYLSSPHSTAEILIYFSLTVILWKNVTWMYAFIFVATNQIETSLLTHWWYQEKFKEFPKNRKALIPYVY